MGRRTRTFYRAVGPPELEQIRANAFRAFPQRGHHEPVVGLMAAEEPARRIARDWNAEGRVGYVTRFELDAAWCDVHVSRDAGDGDERWIATEALHDLNAHLSGEIRVVATLRPPPPTRPRS